MSRPKPKHTDEDAPLAELVRRLTDAVTLLADRFRRKRVSDAAIAVIVTGMLFAGGYYYFIELPDRRAEIRDQIRDLACYAVRLRPPGYSQTSDDLRAKYRCPPFDPNAVPTPGPTPTSTTTRTVPGPTRTAAAPTPSTRTVTDAPAAGPTSTVTRTRTVPGPVRTTTRTAHATVTITRGVCVLILC